MNVDGFFFELKVFSVKTKKLMMRKTFCLDRKMYCPLKVHKFDKIHVAMLLNLGSRFGIVYIDLARKKMSQIFEMQDHGIAAPVIEGRNYFHLKSPF